MHRLHLFVCFLLYSINSISPTSYTCDPTISCGCSTEIIDITARIVGGQIAPDDAWGWAISLQVLGSHQCTGALIAPEYALTAAHCFNEVDDISQMTMLAGTNYLQDMSDTVEERYILNYTVHPGYDKESQINDIAIIHFAPVDVSSNSTTRFICLPTANTDVSPVGSNVIAIGWGVTEENGTTPSDYLRQVTLQIFSPTSQECENGLIENATTQICAGHQGGGKDTCQGDSGGPLMSYINNKWVLAGATSYGVGCGKAGYGGMYTRVSSYIPFITNVMNGFGGIPASSISETATIMSVTTQTTLDKSFTNSAQYQRDSFYRPLFIFIFFILTVFTF